jgi:Thioesterase-like superfamily
VTAFFVPSGERFEPTELTRGPWDPDAQHAGPPAALVGRAVELLPSDGERQVGRITFDILRPVPLRTLWAEAEVVRGGRNVELVEASLLDDDGEIMRARAWRMRPSALDLEIQGPESGSAGFPGKLSAGHTPPGPEEAHEVDFLPTGQDTGYHTAMEYRFASGSFREPGPATAWMRMRHPLVEGEEPTPLARVLTAADSGNGVSATLDWSRWLFINVDLTVHLQRLPAGEWVCLDAVTLPGSNGIGLADTALYDEHGPIGRAAQTLRIGERQSGGRQ